MILNKYIKGSDYLVCLCDDNLLGKTLEEDGLKIEVNVHFYGSDKASREEVIVELNKATIINAIGDESVSTLKEVKSIKKTLMINGVPHAQWIRL